MKKCLNVIVYYENEDEVRRYIHQLADITEGEVDIALVINSDKYNVAKRLVEKIKETTGISITTYDYGENVGYLNALLNIITNVKLQDYRYFMLTNTDIKYENADFFKRLITVHYDDKVGCVAPSVYSTKSRSFSNPHYMERIPREKIERNIKIFSHPHLARVYLQMANLKAKKIRKTEKNSCNVYSPHGCFMIFTDSFISKIKGYKYGVRLYSEESCVGELLRKHNMQCYFDTSLRVIHDESTVTGKIDYKKRFMLWRKSLEYILHEFYK